MFDPAAAGAWTAPVNLALAPGERLVLLGRDFAVRNPLLDVLFGLRTPAAGQVLVNGVPAPKGALRGWSTLVRRPESVSGTLRTNLLLARPDADDAALFAALARVGLADEIGRLPAGLDTHLSAFGGPLDQDQQARLGLARALLSPASVLLVDHALDALCPDSVADVSAGLAADGRALLVTTRLPAVAEVLGGRLRRLVDGRLLPAEEKHHAG
jgi:ABC-type transport system involved in cytochrome bd biosynthesis fused ATPase/permease subunit